MSYTDNKDNITRSFFQCMQRIRHGLKKFFPNNPDLVFKKCIPDHADRGISDHVFTSISYRRRKD